MTRPFLFLLGLAVVLGVGLGGAFIGGMAFGKSQGDAAVANVQSVAAFGLEGSPAAGFAGRNQQGGFEQGPTTQGLDAQGEPRTNSALPGQRGYQDGSDGLVASGGLMGTVASIEGNTVTIDTPRGPVKVILGENTSIIRIVESTVDDLQLGAQVRVMGAEVEGEGVTTTSVTIFPMSAKGIPGEGEFSGKRTPQVNPAGQ